MRKRYTYQDVLEMFINEEYEVLSTEGELLNDKGFIYATTKIKVKCSNGHITDTVTINNFKKGKRCRKCANEQLGKDKKHSYKYIKEYIESFNYRLLSSEYKNAKECIIVQCDKQHKPYSVTFSHFKNGTRCPECAKEVYGQHNKYSYEEVKKHIKTFGYKLLSKEYKNCVTPLTIECPNNHKYESCYTNFKQGHRCPYCNGNAKLTYKQIKEYIESFGYELLSTKYESSNSSLEIKCPNGHITNTMTFGRFKRGHRCKICANAELGKIKMHSIDYVKDYIESFGYKLLSSEYRGANDYINLKCPIGHVYNTGTFSSFQQGCRCPHCHRISNGEQKIMDFLDNLNIKYFHDKGYFKDLLSENGNPLRPDFIIEDRKIWIEYDGGQHYKVIDYFGGLMALLNTKYKDSMKNKYAEENDWKLIRIPYWDYDNIEKILNKELELK